ncbi:hypothetical protein F4802DRAFT_58508 [Xylaria palmicola]|nr:hypothetical protein F4802DRAFT_58508 [Xylaria palmicola]
MDLGMHQVSLEPFGIYGRHTRHPQDMELGVRSGHHHPVALVSSSRHAFTREASRCADGDVKRSCDGSRPSADVKCSTKPCLPPPPTAHAAAVTEKKLAAPPKRGRAPDDVDGPGTAKLPVKKRRLLLQLVTSRLSRRFSLPATHILIRESSGGDNHVPALHRIQKKWCVGGRRARRQSVRKAAILNRVRIGVRAAAVSRGHTLMADLAGRGHASEHGLLLVTTPSNGAMGATLPGPGDEPGTTRGGGVPPVRRPHTTSFHPPVAYGNQHQQQNQQQQQQQDGHQRQVQHIHSHTAAMTDRYDAQDAVVANQVGWPHAPDPSTRTNAQMQRETSAEQARLLLGAPRHATPAPPAARALSDTSDEEDNTAFPAASFRDRYADLSDDDMDDVYADFGVLFGAGAASCSPEARTGVGPIEGQEYLDELDGIPWVV